MSRNVALHCEANKMKEENIFNIRLLKEIEKYPCLYNYNLTEYTSREITDKAWSDIADKFKKTRMYLS